MTFMITYSTTSCGLAKGNTAHDYFHNYILYKVNMIVQILCKDPIYSDCIATDVAELVFVTYFANGSDQYCFFNSLQIILNSISS